MTGEKTNYSIGNGITDNGDGTYTFSMVNESLTLSATFSEPDASHFEQTGTDEYTIKTANGWNWFCFALNYGLISDGFNGKTVKLDKDIEVSAMAGTSNHPFKGTFDGQGKTLTFNLTASEGYSAPFHYTDSATISNLHVTGLIEGGDISSLAGLVGKATGNITISNCHVSTQISTTHSGAAWHGGVIAFWDDSNVKCTITGCVYDGLIYNPNVANATYYCFGFLGNSWGSNMDITFTDCLYAPVAYGTGKNTLGDECYTFVYPNSSPTYNMTNCYYTSILGNRQGRPAVTATTAPANLGKATTDHGLVKGYENGFLYNGNYYTPKYGDAIVEYSFNDWNNERASVTFNGDGDNLVGVNITENVEKVSRVTYNRTFTPGVATTVILPFNYECNGNEGGKFYNFKDVTYDEGQHIWVCKIIAPGEAGSNNVTSLTANTPYLFVPTATKMTFPNIESMTGGVVTLQPTTLNEYGGATTNDNWNFYGTYTGKNWTVASDDYGFAAHGGTAAGGAEEVVAGQFVRYTINASIGPMRCYLRYAGNGALEDTYTVANPDEGDPVRNVPWWDYPDNASAADTYKQISFSAGEGSGTKDVIYIPENRNYILPECNFTAPDGKAFKGWSVKIGDAEAVSKQPGDTIMVMANTTVTAIFEESSTADVTVIAKDTKGVDVGGVALTGTGRYAKNSELTLTAPAAEGYNFVGWFEGGTKLCGTNVYTFTVTKNVDLTAKYEALGKVSLTIDGGSSFTINGAAKSTSITADYTLGTTITVATDTAKFAYWKNSYGMVLSRSASYTFTVTGADTITAVFDTVVENKATLVFESAYGQVMAREQLAKGGSMEIPSLPYRNGYTAKGWDMNGDGVYSADDTVAAAITRGLAATNNMVVISPVYELKNVTYTITVTGGTGGGTYNQNDKVTVTANEPESGKKFSHWTDGTSILSYNASYPFFADRNLTLTAVFVAEETVVEAKGTTEIISTSIDTENKKMTFVSLSSVPEGCTIKMAGLIFTLDADLATTDNGSGFTDSTAVMVRGESWSGTSFRYTWTITGVKAGKTVYARAYLVYTDTNGNSHTVYGGVESLTL